MLQKQQVAKPNKKSDQDKQIKKQPIQQQKQTKVSTKPKQTLLKCFSKNTIFTMFLFLDTKSILQMKRVCKFFNEIFIVSSPRLLQYSEQLNNEIQQQIKLKYPVDQFPQLEEVNYQTLKKNFETFIPFSCEEKIQEQNRHCLELLFNLASMNMSFYQKKKYNFEMKMKTISQKYHFDIYKITDQEREIISSMAEYEFHFQLYNEDYDDVVNYVKNLITLSSYQHYQLFCQYKIDSKQIQQQIKFSGMLKKIQKKYGIV